MRNKYRVTLFANGTTFTYENVSQIAFHNDGARLAFFWTESDKHEAVWIETNLPYLVKAIR